MKKITLLITIILALVMVLGSSVIVYAQEPTTSPEPEVKIDGGTAYQGDYTYLYVRPTNWKDIVGVEIFVYYDETAFEVSNVYEQSGLNGANTTINHATPGEVSVRAVSTGPIAESGSALFYIPLHVKPDAVAGKYSITLAVGEAYGSDISAKTIKAYSSYVTVNDKPPIKNTLYSYANVDKSIAQCEIATIDYQVGNGYGFASGDFTVDYDESKLNLEEVVISDTMRGTPEANAVISVNDTVPGFIKIAYTSLVGINSAYPLFSLKFSALQNEEATTSVVISANNLCDTKFNVIGGKEVANNINTLYTKPVTNTSRIVLDDYQGYDADFTLNLTADMGTKLAAGDFELTYNTSYLKCTGVDQVDNSNMLTVNPNFANGIIKFSFICEKGISSDTVVARIKFENVKVGTSLVGVVGKSLVDKDFNALDVEYVDSTVTTEHEMILVPRLEPTCTEQGHEAYKKCKHCNYTTSIVEIPATGHSYKDTIVPPTCTEKGYTHHVCTVCGHSYNSDIVDALGHSYVDKVTLPTCTEKGYTTHTCSVCGDAYIDNYVEATGHSFGEWRVTTEPSCLEKGEKRRYCANCDAFESETIDALGHNYVDTIIPPTCTEQGYTKHVCSRCQDTIIDTYVDALQHDYIVVVTPPTCTEQGYTTHTCKRGDHEYVDNYVDAKGHTFGEWTIETDSTCTKEGVEKRYCSECDVFETRVIEKKPHTYVDTIVPPTCTEKGYTKHVCSVCKHEYIDTYVDALQHDYTVVVTPPTCTEQGYTTHTCKRGDHEYKDNYVEAKGHSFGEWIVETPASCTVDGVEKRYCSECDVFETRPIPALKHEYIDKVVAPTCVEKGYTLHTCIRGDHEYKDNYVDAIGHKYVAVVTPPTHNSKGYTTYTCSECGDSYIADYVDIVPHTFGDWQVINAPTCTEDGVEKRVCTDPKCGYSETRPINKLGHDYIAVVTPPTCTEQGYTTYTCSRCSDSYIDDYVVANGHSFGAWKVETPATCNSQGEERRYCSACDAFETRVIPQLEHKYNSVVTNPTCLEQGFTTYTCTLCGYSYKADYVPKLGHDYVATIVQPTCTTKGYTQYKCSRCGATYNDNYVDMLPHNYGEWHVVKDTTCTENGLRERKCQSCGNIEQEVILSKGHTYNKISTIAPTCTDKGYSTYECSICHEKYNDDYIEALGHDYVSVVTPPTCTSRGYTTYTCSRCHASHVDDYIGATGHNFGGWITTVPPTCTTTGIEVCKCANCGMMKSRTLPALVHQYTEVITPPTCIDRGYTTYTCTLCGASYRDDYVDAIGHSFTPWKTTKEPTCQHKGTEERSCERCHLKETRDIAPLVHEYEEIVVAPTCTTQGYTIHRCIRCGASYNNNYVDALGHTYGEYSVIEPATCTHIGTKVRICTKCGKKDITQIPKNEHTYIEVITSPTCESKGYTKYVCSTCNHSYIGSFVNPIGHNYIDKVVLPTCTTGGYVQHTCSRCSKTYISDEVDALGHSYVDIITPPTCVEKGYTTHTCARCHYEYIDNYVEAKGHNWGEWITTKEPNCIDTGSAQRECVDCGTIETKELPALGHKYVDEVVPATCTDKGYTHHKCGICGDEYIDNYTQAKGHNFGDWIVVKEPTTQETGLKVRVCHCGVKEEEIIPKIEEGIVEPEPEEKPETKPEETNPTDPPKKKGNALAIGLGVGIPLTSIAIITPIIFVVIKRKRLR